MFAIKGNKQMTINCFPFYRQFRVRIFHEDHKILCFKFLSFLNKRFDDDIMMMKIIKRRNYIVWDDQCVDKRTKSQGTQRDKDFVNLMLCQEFILSVLTHLLWNTEFSSQQFELATKLRYKPANKLCAHGRRVYLPASGQRQRGN